MIGHIIMEVEHAEIVAAVQFYLNKSAFNTLASDYHKARVTEVRQRTNGNFVIEFDGWQSVPKETNDGTDDIT